MGDFATNENILVEIENLGMNFRMPEERIDSLKEFAIRFVKRKLKYKNLEIINDLNLTINKGESLALIGKNGVGKSTLLRIIAGIIDPTAGTVKTRGNMVPLLQLGAGFDKNASGRENVYLNGALMGFSKSEMRAKYDSIVKFAELGDKMNVPLKNYSSGMLARLGFSIAVDVSPDILLVDEILAVGDENFKQKCSEKIADLQKEGATFIIVTHSMAQARKLCQKALWVETPDRYMYGDVDTVTKAYLDYCQKLKTENEQQK